MSLLLWLEDNAFAVLYAGAVLLAVFLFIWKRREVIFGRFGCCKRRYTEDDLDLTSRKETKSSSHPMHTPYWHNSGYASTHPEPRECRIDLEDGDDGEGAVFGGTIVAAPAAAAASESVARLNDFFVRTVWPFGFRKTPPTLKDSSAPV